MEQIDALTVGKLIKEYRNLAGITQFELAEIIDIDERQMGKIERGVHYPSVPTFLKLIKVLNIDIGKLYCHLPVSEPAKLSPSQNKLIKFARTASENDITLACKILEVVNLANKL